MAADKSNSKGQSWFCTPGLPSNIAIDVDGMTFHLHKFPLISKSKTLHDLISEQESQATPSFVLPINHGPGDGTADPEIQPERQLHILLRDFPGGSQTFEAAAKFCYGVKIELSASNVVPLRCAGEVLEMTEEYSEDNLVLKTEIFLSHSVFRSLRDSIRALWSCENLLPMAETLGIVQRCIDAVSTKAASVDPSMFGWPVNDVAAGPRTKATRSKARGRRGGGGSSNSSSSNAGGDRADTWYDELSHLSLCFFKRLIFAMAEEGLSADIIESCLTQYAKKRFPGINRCNRKPSSSSVASEAEQRELLETIVANLPTGRTSTATPAAARFFFGLLRTANILDASEACKGALERKIGSQLEQATLDDLLIPSYSYLNETLYDVDCVQRMLRHFLDSYYDRVGEGDGGGAVATSSSAIMLVGKLIDGYLSEIASDANLKPERFCDLAVCLPGQARWFDDGLYRAVDVYLKAHPWVSEAERERICGVIDCHKLTLEACTHAAQNERLPLRAVVQVLFFEQLQLRNAIAGTLLTDEAAGAIESASGGGGGQGVGVAGVEEESSSWRTAMRVNQVLRLDMDTMRARVKELERECTTMKKALEKMDEAAQRGGGVGGWRSSLTKKFGCKLKAQVCHSHQPTVVEARKVRQQGGNQHRPSST